MKNPFSKTQIDRLGDRLKGGPYTESDLRLLDDYRRSFGEAYEAVVRTISQRGEFPSGRPAKSTVSIVEKLRRESIRLSQMQDIAGCRVVVANVVEQERVVASLRSAFPAASIIDRRTKPSYDYRAVHVIVRISGKMVEIQVRSALQHLWAEFSEKLSDVVDATIKYGGGADVVRKALTALSERIAVLEVLELQIGGIETQIAGLAQRQVPEQYGQQLQKAQEFLVEVKGNIIGARELLDTALNEAISGVEKLRGRKT